MKALVFFAAVYGAALCVGELKVGQRLRDLGRRLLPWRTRWKDEDGSALTVGDLLFRCPICLSFWFGAAFSLLVFPLCYEWAAATPAGRRLGWPWLAVHTAVWDGFAAVAVSFVLHGVVWESVQAALDRLEGKRHRAEPPPKPPEAP